MRRSGHLLVDVLLSTALVAGSLLAFVDLTRANASGARFNERRICTEQLLLDLLEMVVAEVAADGRGVAADTTGRLAELIDRRMKLLPDEDRELLRPVAGELEGRVSCRLEEAGQPANLIRVTLEARTASGGHHRFSRVIRSDSGAR